MNALDPRLLEILVCPQCKGELEYQTTPPTLLCQECGVAYEVRDGIPIMLLEEARPLK